MTTGGSSRDTKCTLWQRWTLLTRGEGAGRMLLSGGCHGWSKDSLRCASIDPTIIKKLLHIRRAEVVSSLEANS